jgi:hypothetical protein
MTLSFGGHGVPPCWRAYFLLLRQKKVAKEKATPGSAPLRGSFRYSASRAACLNSPAAQTRQADCPRPACVAQRLSRGPKGVSGSKTVRFANFHGQPEKTAKNEICLLLPLTPSPSLPRPRHTRDSASRRAKRESSPPLDSRLRGSDGTGRPARVVSPGPLRGAEQRRGWRIKGEDCLRAQPEFRSPRQSRVAQGTGNAGTDPGVAFSLATFFWPHKRKYARQQGGNPSQLEKPETKP